MARINGNQKPQALDFDYVSSPIEVLFKKFNTSPKGLSAKEAKRRFEEYGYILRHLWLKGYIFKKVP